MINEYCVVQIVCEFGPHDTPDREAEFQAKTIDACWTLLREAGWSMLTGEKDAMCPQCWEKRKLTP